MTRILVADDDRTTRLLLTEILREGKYTVVAVPDGAAALKKLREDKFDLALLDV
jgi:CheY-like chemotaxis protein